MLLDCLQSLDSPFLGDSTLSLLVLSEHWNLSFVLDIDLLAYKSEANWWLRHPLRYTNQSWNCSLCVAPWPSWIVVLCYRKHLYCAKGSINSLPKLLTLEWQYFHIDSTGTKLFAIIYRFYLLILFMANFTYEHNVYWSLWPSASLSSLSSPLFLYKSFSYTC